MSVFMPLTTFVFVNYAFDLDLIFTEHRELVLFIGINYAGFTITQFLIALTSAIQSGIFKIFQWVFWLLISVLSFLAVL